MADSGDLIDFELIENQKENIQALPSGRSAKALASLFSPLAARPSPTLSQTQDLNDAARQEYEKELTALDESDDPLDVYDRYVKWTLDAYPSAQATPESRLLPLLERATTAFLSSTHYKNDPRYLRLWLHYIRMFCDSPRDIFVYLARHSIGENLALFYEEFAAWLENAGRWTQAEEVYNLGLEKGARPVERLTRKVSEFRARFENRPKDEADPTSPALPIVRPALAAKIDPFSTRATSSGSNPQAAQNRSTTGSKPPRPKMAIFSDADASEPKVISGDKAKGWERIGTVAERKRENTREPTAWTGEKLTNVAKGNVGMPKMMVFRDPSASNNDNEIHLLRNMKNTVNARTGRTECVFVDLEAVYPSNDPMTTEYCFEELRARHRGWLNHDWRAKRVQKAADLEDAPAVASIVVEKLERLEIREAAPATQQKRPKMKIHCDNEDVENIPPTKAQIEEQARARRSRREERANRTRKIRTMEVHNETTKVMTNLDSPTGKKVKRKKTAEPTMTFHTREAMDEIYGIFNQPLASSQTAADESDHDSSDDDDYTSGGESTETGRMSASASEFGDTTSGDFTTQTTTGSDDDDEDDEDETRSASDVKSVSEWSDFTASKHIPKHSGGLASEDDTQTEGNEADPSVDVPFQENRILDEELATPTSPRMPIDQSGSHFAPIPPEDIAIPTHPYRDPGRMAQNRLPFMTPIVEKTESSMGAVTTARQDYFNSKTPTRPRPIDGEPWSSPLQDPTEEVEESFRVPQPDLKKTKPALIPKKEVTRKAPLPPKGPIILDAQCNPVEDQVKETILSQVQPPLTSYDGYFEDKSKVSGRSAEIRKFTKAISKVGRNSTEKTATNLSMPPSIKLEGSGREYVLKKELGKGAFAPVYLAQSLAAKEDDEEDGEALIQMGKGAFGVERGEFEAIKMEEPPSAWEFYMIRQAKRRLGVSRAVESIVQAYEMHVFKDECFLIEEYRSQGTLLDLVNLARADPSSGGVLDEQLAMFFTIELIRTVEALHSKGLLHGDIKSDNVLVRLQQSEDGWTSQYARDGTNGWSNRGITIIDFGRGIDMKAFKPDVQFIADWKTSEADCAEMRELRPWTYQVDYHGVACAIHNLLFGKYIETVAERGAALGAGQTKTYKIRESLKRYWQTDLWAEAFSILLNPLLHLEAEEGRKMPILKSMRTLREKMEQWLEANCEKGVGLKSHLRRMEGQIRERRK